MAPTDFTCSICAKSFENRKSQTRHISYCRKSKGRIRSRKKACLICTKAKTHCDAAYPKCSRCSERNLVCGYERPPVPEATTLSQPTLEQSLAEASGTASSVSDSAPQSSMQLLYRQPDPFFQNQDASPGPLGGDFGSGETVENPGWHLESDSYTSAVTIQDPNSTQSNFAASLGYPDSASVPPNAFQTQFPVASSEYIQPPAESLLYCEPRSSTGYSSFEAIGNLSFDHIVPKAPKAFWPRRVRDHQLSLNRNYVICTLRSYPHMMLPGRQLPPFIHPQCLVNVSGDDPVVHKSLPGPLATCAGIIQMYSVKNRDNAVFIWRAIRMEQERLSEECSQYNYFNTVAALQAVTVYFLLRLSEDNDDATNFDVPLIHTMIKLAVKVKGLGMKYANPSDGCTPTWEGWVLAESLRRTIIILFLVDLLFDVTTALQAHVCDGTQFAGMTLPSGRDLWRASTKSDWERAYINEFSSPLFSSTTAPYKPLTYDDLLNYRFRADDALDSWLAQVDDFGTLVMAAASLHGTNAMRRGEKDDMRESFVAVQRAVV